MTHVTLTGNPPAFECPKCKRVIHAEVGKMGLILRGSCKHKIIEFQQTADKGLVAVFV